MVQPAISTDYFVELPARQAEYLKAEKARGRAVVGVFCEYTPRELLYAAGAIPTCLCGGSHETAAAAEEHLPANLCALVKSSYGYALTGKCAFYELSDLVIAETTCDGKKKMFELLEWTKPGKIHVLELPQKPLESEARGHWLAEVWKMKEFLEQHLNTPITDKTLRTAIAQANRERELLRRLHDFTEQSPPYLSGTQMVMARPIVMGDPTHTAELEALIGRLEARQAAGPSDLPPGPRILMTGVPTVRGAWKVIRVIEDCGAHVVVQESCTGWKSIEEDVPLNGDPMANIAERYLRLPCPCMTPNVARMELLSRLIHRFHPDGVIELTWVACLTYAVESHQVRQHIAERHGLPYLRIETDYSEADREQIANRVTAFVEMLGG